MLDKIKNQNQGVIALLLVIMITALTVVSVVVVSMTNISDLMSSYYFSEGEEAAVDMDVCIEDALFRLASSTDISGDYYLNSAGINCQYQISLTNSLGLKTVTSTASTTSSLGYWGDTVVVLINVSSTPIRVDSYKNFNMSYTSIVDFSCGDSSCNGTEVCGTDDTPPACNSDCGTCTDTTAPAVISDLALSGATTNSIDLDWTAPGDDGSTGTATTYNVRYSTSAINSGNFDSATAATGEPSPSVASTAESMTVSSLSADTLYYFAMKTSDEVPNTSAISNLPSLATSAGGDVCGDGVVTGIEGCDYTGALGVSIPACYLSPVGCTTEAGCLTDCSACVATCKEDILLSCFPAGTKILMEDNSYKNIEDIKVGEMVLSYDEENKKQVAAEVLELETPIRDHMCEITFSQGASLKLTNEHPVFTDEGWKSIEPIETAKEIPALFVRKLKKGDKVLFADSIYKEVAEINCWQEKNGIQTYNLKSVKKYNTFYAEDVLVHNKFCAYLFSQEDGQEHFEFVTLGVFEEPGNFNSKILLDRMFIENEGYSYINLEKETNKFILRIPPHEIDYIDHLALKVIDVLDENHFSFLDKFLDFFGLLDKEKIYNLKLLNSSEGYDLLVNEDANRFALDGETRYPHELSLVFEELPETEEGYVRKVQFVEKGYYEAFEGSAIWYDFAPFNQAKWKDWLLKGDNYSALKNIISDVSYNHYKIGGEHSSLFEEKVGSFLPEFCVPKIIDSLK